MTTLSEFKNSGHIHSLRTILYLKKKKQFLLKMKRINILACFHIPKLPLKQNFVGLTIQVIKGSWVTPSWAWLLYMHRAFWILLSGPTRRVSQTLSFEIKNSQLLALDLKYGKTSRVNLIHIAHTAHSGNSCVIGQSAQCMKGSEVTMNGGHTTAKCKLGRNLTTIKCQISCVSNTTSRHQIPCWCLRDVKPA